MTKRLASIDVFRALTMFLMVFVNDLDAVPRVPEWIKHVKENVDGLGFADTIFPAFLFIVGLSIPFSIKNRLDKGDSRALVLWHAVLRSLALLIMGFFHVNFEDYTRVGPVIIPRGVWEMVMTLCFFAIWMSYPKSMPRRRRLIIQIAGILGLVGLAIVYRGGEDGVNGLGVHWWGILGLIGWSYLICAGIYVLTGGGLWIQVAACAFFIAFDTAFHAGWLHALRPIHRYIWIVGNGSMPALTMGGIVTALLYTRLTRTTSPVATRTAGSPATRWYLVAPLLGAALIAFGFLVRPYGGISKVHDTPSWVCICMGISVIFFGFLTWLVDKRGKTSWFSFLMPAGTSALTCYLIPYLLYSIFIMTGFKYPYPFNEGIGGFIRSVAVALFCVWVTGLLEKRRWNLKI